MVKNRNLLTLFGVLLLLLFLLSFSANIRFLLSSQAASGGKDFSIDNSYLFASPIEARADNSEKIRVTVFVLNKEGIGVANKAVVLDTAVELVVNAVQANTDNYGRAMFDLVTGKEGEYFVQSSVDNLKLGEGIKVKFN